MERLTILRPVPTGAISRRPTPIVGRLLSADSRGFKILNMFDRASRPTITESAVESADSAVESADSMADSSADSVKIGLWVRAFSQPTLQICCTDQIFFQSSTSWLLYASGWHDSSACVIPTIPSNCFQSVIQFQNCSYLAS